MTFHIFICTSFYVRNNRILIKLKFNFPFLLNEIYAVDTFWSEAKLRIWNHNSRSRKCHILWIILRCTTITNSTQLSTILNTIASFLNLFIKSTENDNQQHQHKRAYFLKMNFWKKIIKLGNEIVKTNWHKHRTKAFKKTLLITASVKCFWWMVNENNEEFCPNLQMNSCLFLTILSTFPTFMHRSQNSKSSKGDLSNTP